MSNLLEQKLLEIFNALLKEFNIWRKGESQEEPLIINIHDKVVANDPTSAQGIMNRDNIGLTIYSAITDLMRNYDISRSLAVLTYHLVVSHPFIDGNKRTALGLLLNILYELFEDKMEIPQDLEDQLIRVLIEISDYPPEEDEDGINRIRNIIEDIIHGILF
ncbi:type II toxin-antitoxin system death-on-curing family toxin [Metallosphaera hakonensis]|uniref:Type II toxin-antitoxin system death-on-curing family toxin n=1 Tax=Metallosphaera hakonensis JCM 8857 = DSM 7519 TaxID=1293036 RepID=A0A2U9IRI2_9CREN|nr:type II toxin-antitoxin system death-on-curing family toxin [Metallosphaera hakonensis]AWR98658.1 type II toxin-antitoxin system death-on-curing family toxin [Metallosphaera hakonensis JCM 8857 = DSM 7519]